jgi:hypothetical protein
MSARNGSDANDMALAIQATVCHQCGPPTIARGLDCKNGHELNLQRVQQDTLKSPARVLHLLRYIQY